MGGQLIEITHFYDLLSKRDSIELHAVLIGDMKPDFFGKPGRTALLPLKVSLQIAGHTISALKIKGIGLYDHLGILSAPTPDYYFRLHKHVGFSEDGRLKLVESSADIFGGLTLTRAMREFRNCSKLASVGSNSALPFAVYLPDAPTFLQSEIERPGIVITGIPSNNAYRLDLIFDRDIASNKAKQDTVSSWLKHPPKYLSEIRALDFLGLFNSIGKELWNFHKAGLFRYSGHLENIGVHADGSERVFLTDFDSSLHRDGHTTPDNEALYLIRDVASILYGMIKLSTNRHNIDSARSRLDDFVTLASEVCVGYFCDSGISKLFTRTFTPFYEQIASTALAAHGDNACEPPDQNIYNYQDHHRKLRQETWLRRFDIYANLIYALSELYRHSFIQDMIPLAVSRDDLVNRLVDFIQSLGSDNTHASNTVRLWAPFI